MGLFQNSVNAWNAFWEPFFNPEMREQGFSDPYIGDYAGQDQYLGAGEDEGEYGQEMRESVQESLKQFRERGTGAGPRGAYGIGESLQESGINWNFDVTNQESIARALAKKEFEAEMQGQLDTGKIYEHDLYAETENYGPMYGSITDEGYATVDPQGASWAFGDWWDERQQGYMDRAKLGAITEQELAQLDPGASKWRKMTSPLKAEATDVYRQGLGSIMSGLGNIKTGSSMRQRKEMLENYGQQMTNIRGGARKQRQSLADSYTERIGKIFDRG